MRPLEALDSDGKIILKAVVEITNTMHRFAPLLYSIYWFLHVSAVVCHRQGASGPV
jgi:hypothetical protein